MTKKEIDQKYIDQANQLEIEFFDIVDESLPSQHRVLKDGKTEADFNLQHGYIWKAHETELIAKGFMEALTPPEPVRDLAAEIDDLKARADDHEVRLKKDVGGHIR